ncbi:uncharacterized protein [Arachis hypogaea]|uniref:uncharacterized protein n=1 Tax=Arachis hypogaea TaxID=3818 RepID=UPI003B20BB2F
MASLFEAGFIRELDYSTWLSNVVLVKKTNGKWRMYVDYSNLNKVIVRFEIPVVMVSDNDTQFFNKKFGKFLSGLEIKQKFSSVEYPQSNKQAGAANKVILSGLKKHLDKRKGSWADELASVLRSYRTTPQSFTWETPFWLTYGVDPVIPVKVGEPRPRLLLGGSDEATEKDLIDETREMAHLLEVALKQRLALRYNRRVQNRRFKKGD